jgi:aryl-alcohol dehydrogenase-like predicted oxidoreductase
MNEAVGAQAENWTGARSLGHSGISVSALGFGCWAIGGPMRGADGKPIGWGEVDDRESARAIRAALDAGVTFFDTADVYGGGHSERLLGETLGADRDRVVIATKFGIAFDEKERRATGTDSSPGYVRRACEASLARLGTDRIDLLQLHIGDASTSDSDGIAGVLEELVQEGIIRAYGWSTDDAARAEHWALRGTCSTIQHTLNVFQDAPAVLDVCERHGLASINRSPLAAGFLGGKYVPGTRIGANDWRTEQREWSAFFTADGEPEPAWLLRLDAIREILVSEGRTPAQGAIAWLWARSPTTVPIPGVRTVAQAEDNAGALAFGPLRPEQLAEIDALLTPLA